MSAIIEEWRRNIDELDSQIVALLNRRAEYALQIGREKQKRGQAIRSPEREAEVLKRAISQNTGPLNGGAIQKIFQVILDESRKLQEQEFRSSQR
ncbi:MAG: hypothetical protein A2Z21_10660 [Candidatus Fraserbacteria bacterium RBG_16_55_9]|uniref:Chorismate mutase domain-containing protein n=1 Tax=Fraserbacteria sp. (strain RBG_16_55_9) TaxID=1817864 RepID=A0A1F5UQ63_FRAXR|nr:MAG: hypothetical protein A2Z21_10660 [Candidatus Fraserbacteria bacterium RBG_16_55_9]